MEVKYWHVSVVTILAGLVQLGLLILLCAMKTWVIVTGKYEGKELTFYVGVFGIDQAVGGILIIKKNHGYVTLLAMLVLGMLMLASGIVFQALSWAKRSCMCCSPKGLLRLAATMYLVSDIFLMIGLTQYDLSYWKNIKWKGDVTDVSWHYWWAYIVGWIMSLAFLVFVLARAVFVNFIIDIRKVMESADDKKELITDEPTVQA